MVHKFDPARMGSLTSERRQQAVRPLELLQRAGIKAGDRILDWGCGAGFFALPAARLAGAAGNVTAVDIQTEMVAATQQAADQEGLTNIKVMAAGEYDLPLGLPAFDWVILAYILHEVHDPGRLLTMARGALKPGGRLLTIEWPKEIGPHGPPAAERLAPADLAALYQPLGLQEVDFWEIPPEYYALVLRRVVNG
jgi:ubiquinone/menaquinone biosynthesis C-methylase UbiE